MRKCLILFMLFLLPIRGLVGDAMAYSMLPMQPITASAQQHDATHLEAARAIFDWTSAAFHSNLQEKSALSAPCHIAAADSEDSDAVQNQCTTCQVCHLSAASPVQLHDGLLKATTALPVQAAPQWHSADTRLFAKPPVF